MLPTSPFRHRQLLLLVGSLLLALGAFFVTDALLRHNEAEAGLYLTIPANDPARGLVYVGLQGGGNGTCVGGYILPSSGLCTHGPDAAPDGVNVTTGKAPAPASAQDVTQVSCDGDGKSGARPQVIYARPVGNADGDRSASYLSTFRQIVTEADTIYDASAAETGGSRRVRFVTDANCTIAVANVVLSSTGADTFDKTITELQAQGYNRADRKYLVFMDANVLCGIGTLYNDEKPTTDNLNNGAAAGYARIDAPCWTAHSVAHEHMHTLGGVQNSAPHASGGSHCVDEYDVMCYSDTPNRPTLRYLCNDTTHENRFDCNHDDYYSTNPTAGTYLATHWNTANSSFLIASNTVTTTAGPTPSASPAPTPSATPSPSPQPSPSVGDGVALTIVSSPGGLISPGTSGAQTLGSTVTLRATPASDYLFIGWMVDATPRGWTTTLALKMDGAHTVSATFVQRPVFTDVPTNSAAAEAIAQLAARKIIRGYDATTFGPNDPVLRAQMAALIARAMGWDADAASNPFPDQNGVDADLWRNVAVLAQRGVAKGYADGKGGTYYDPTGQVLHAQTISFITRAMIAQGSWQAQPIDARLFGGVLNGTGHEQDVSTYISYTQALGGIPDYPTSGAFADWNKPATRGWFAQALWTALSSVSK